MHYLALVATVLVGSSAAPGDASSLVGSWTLPQGDAVTSFVFSKDGTCIFANKPKKDEKAVEESGKYAVESDKLTITLEDRTLVFQFSLQDGRLNLRGDKLPKEGATFRKDETIDFRKLVGNWEANIPGGAKVFRDGEFKVPGSSSKVYRFRGDGTFSNDDVDDEGTITTTTAGRYSVGEDNTITFKVGDQADAVFKIKLKENAMTLRGGDFPPDGRTFVRKKEKGAKTEEAVKKGSNPEDKKSDPAKLPGDAVWELSELKSPFKILKTTYDPERARSRLDTGVQKGFHVQPHPYLFQNL